MTSSFAQTRGGDRDFFSAHISIFRNEKYISTVEEGTPSYYNALMRLQILNVSCKINLDNDDGNPTKANQFEAESDLNLSKFELFAGPHLSPPPNPISLEMNPNV